MRVIVEQGELDVLPLCCDRSRIDQVRSWKCRRNSGLENGDGDSGSNLLNGKYSAYLECGFRERRTMCIRRNNPIAWNTGRACAPMTVPHKSRPPCHGKREKLIQLWFVKMTGFQLICVFQELYRSGRCRTLYDGWSGRSRPYQVAQAGVRELEGGDVWPAS